MSSSSPSPSPTTSPWLKINLPLPVSLGNNNSERGSISPLSLSHHVLDTPPYISLDAPPPTLYAPPNSPCHPRPRPAQRLRPNFGAYRHHRQYSKQGMVYRAIDEKIDLVRFLQAYESVLSAFGVREDLVAGSVAGEEREREREKLEVAERIVFRLFWNDKMYEGRSGCGSVPLTRVDADKSVTGVNISNAQRVTSSEVQAINAIVDEAYEGLCIASAPAIDMVGKKYQMPLTVTEVMDVAGETGALIGENSAIETMDGGSCTTARQVIDTIGKKDRITSTVTEVVEVSVGTNPSIVQDATCEIADGGLRITAGSSIHTTGKDDRISSTVTEVTEGSTSPGAATLRKATSGMTNGDSSTITFVKPEPDADADAETFYEEMIKGPKILLLRRWGCDRYAEWVKENRKAEEAQDDNAKKEVFRLMELKHRLLPLQSGNPPYTYRIISLTQHHRDSYTGLMWGVNVAQRTEGFLNVRFQWTCKTGTHNDITVEPMSLDELAADEIKGRHELENAHAFLGFWDWLVRQKVYFFAGKVRPMHEICLHWLDSHSLMRQAYLQKQTQKQTQKQKQKGYDSRSSEKGKRQRSGNREREAWNWREKRTVSGASYVGGKKRCVSGGGGGGGNRGKEGERRWEDRDRLEYSNGGLRRVRRRTAFDSHVDLAKSQPSIIYRPQTTNLRRFNVPSVPFLHTSYSRAYSSQPVKCSDEEAPSESREESSSATEEPMNNTQVDVDDVDDLFMEITPESIDALAAETKSELASLDLREPGESRELWESEEPRKSIESTETTKVSWVQEQPLEIFSKPAKKPRWDVYEERTRFRSVKIDNAVSIAPQANTPIRRNMVKGDWVPPKRETWMQQKLALKEKFPEGWMPKKRLSPEAQAGIRALHAQYPEQYSTPALADLFKVSAEAIRRILRTKWVPQPEEEVDRTRRWFQRGKNIWGRYAELGLKPPRKWREQGIGRGKPEWKKRKAPVVTTSLPGSVESRRPETVIASPDDEIGDRIF
ncbi:hypothetical protein DSL72_006416 [Monilinia vaccinii-corymbosi]|uniref:Required for respiratory growth protein 9, mitochondrial n=1 Tax=Monilinia vaccinii-corymbosi TaxID=61207 RepID=A0A8A3PNY3_9HELO|nr:hypothetical protein DSL72_006416 [Monilinia vaccinii-corymbosi]